MEAPLVTIGIPCYNSADYLLPCLESILAQSYQNSEVILVDDCSDDATLEIANQFLDKFKNRLFIHQNASRLGMAGNWNRILELANGEYIKIMGHDDVLHETGIARQVSILDQFPEISVVTSHWKIIGPRGKLVLVVRKLEAEKILDGKLIREQCLESLDNKIGQPSAVLFRAKDAKKLGGFNADFKYYLDMIYWIELLNFGNVYSCNKPVYAFRIHGKSATANLKNLRNERQHLRGYSKKFGVRSSAISASITDLKLWFYDLGRSLLFFYSGLFR